MVGEQIIINENEEYKTSITAADFFDTSDIKAVFQDSDALNTSLHTNFIADTVLYEQELADFGAKDQLVVSGGNTGRIAGRNFTPKEGGIKVNSIIKYQTGNADPTFNRVSAIRADGTAITLAATPVAVAGVNRRTVTNNASGYTFSLMVPKIRQYGNNGLYSTPVSYTHLTLPTTPYV